MNSYWELTGSPLSDSQCKSANIARVPARITGGAPGCLARKTDCRRDAVPVLALRRLPGIDRVAEMHVEVVLAALVLVIAVLVAADFFRRAGDSPHGYPEGPAQNAGRDAFPAARPGSASSLSPVGPAGAESAGADPAGADPAAADRRPWLVRT